jgi:hypothetical protein
MSDAMIEAVARAIDTALAREIECDVHARDLTRDEQCKIATAAIAAASPLIRAHVEREIAEWFRSQCSNPIVCRVLGGTYLRL